MVSPAEKTCCQQLDRAHPLKISSASHDVLKYVLFQAAVDGCLPCVRKLVEEYNVDPFVQSTKNKYTALEIARYASIRDPEKSTCKHAEIYLKAFYRVANKCPGPRLCYKPFRHRCDDPHWRRCPATADGCLEGVRRLVEIEGVDPSDSSRCGGYAVMELADYFIDQHNDSPGCEAVKQYLLFKVHLQADSEGLLIHL